MSTSSPRRSTRLFAKNGASSTTDSDGVGVDGTNTGLRRRRAGRQPAAAPSFIGLSAEPETSASEDEDWRIHSKPIHTKARLTVLSTYNKNEVSYEGLYNLGGLVLILANLREVLINVAKYGVLFNPLHFFWWFQDPYSWPGLTTFISLGIYFIVIFAIQNALMLRLISPDLARLLGVVVVALCIVITSAIVWVWIEVPITGLFCTMSLCIAAMKLYSYVVVNHEEYLHWAEGGFVRRKVKQTPRQYPENVTVRNMLFFLWVPTLCYQLDYPRAERIKKRRVTRFLLQTAFLLGLIWVVAEQYMTPLIRNAVEVYNEGKLVYITERLLKMAIPNLAIWLLGFYLIWETLLGLLAELLRFDDRRFYDDWWNATSLPYFWRTWNKPIHHWFLRHVFHPLESAGYKQKHVVIFVFFISGIVHELVISLSFHTVGWWAFFALMLQPLLTQLAKPLSKSWAGNVFFWVTISFGQPFAVLMYSVDWFARHPGGSEWKFSASV